ncbi:MAG: Ldh family oxidoreductase [Acuticoccus sp.]
MANAMERIETTALHSLVQRIFAARGMRAGDAAMVADVLVWADASGHPSHGVTRVPRYVELAGRGDLDVTAEPVVAADSAALVTIDGCNAPGAVAMAVALREVRQRVAQHGIALAAVGRAGHIGPAGYYAQQMVEQGMIAMIGASGIPLMAYHGTAAPTLSTAPLAIGVPSADGPPLVLDMASSVAAMGKIREAARRGEAIPPGWALTRDGEETTDPDAAHILTPLGGPKGSGLAFMLECLTSLLAGAPVLAPTLAGTLDINRQSVFVVAIDVKRLRPLADFTADVAALTAVVEAQPRADGVSQVLMPGARSARHRAEARAHGGTIEVDEELLATLRAMVGS